ncbi:hypothetical protein [Kitasatospora sp. NPDC059327]|uniref:hypothetical protein n=1 Tax=Kitasatospora sp. NPDC059327 TaxID=3346803 RepID=UPI0036C73575
MSPSTARCSRPTRPPASPRWPPYSNCVIYPASEATALAVIPRTPDGGQVAGAFRLGIQPGWVKQEGVRPLAWYTERHAEGVNPARYIARRANERDTEGE